MPLPFLFGLAGVIGAAVAGGVIKSEENGNSDECTVSEASDILGLSEYTIKKKIREGELKARLAGKRYMISSESMEEYAKKAGKRMAQLNKASVGSVGAITGGAVLAKAITMPDEIIKAVKGISSEIWNNITLLQDFIDNMKLQQDIISVEIKKDELVKEMAVKSNDEAKINEISQDIMNKEIEKLKIAQTMKLCETQIHYLEDPVNDLDTAVVNESKCEK